MSLSFRLATTDELDLVIKLIGQAILWQANIGLPAAFGNDRRTEATTSVDMGTCYVGLENGDVVATFSLEQSDAAVWANAKGSALYLHRLVVSPEQHNRGIGTECIAFAEAQALQSGAEFLRLDAVEENETLCSYYEHRGFQRVGVVKLPSWKRSSALFQKLLLEHASTDNFDEIIEVVIAANEALAAKGQPKAWMRIPEGGVLSDLENQKTFVVRHNLAIIGTASLHLDDPEVWGPQPPNALYLHRLAVHPSHQGHGIGSGIIKWAEYRVNDAGRTYLRLDAIAEHAVMCAGYEKRGFQPMGLVKPDSYMRPAMRYQKLVSAGTPVRA